MGHSAFDNKELDRAGERLVRSLKNADVVDRLVSDPFLFARVKGRIAESHPEIRVGTASFGSLVFRHRLAFATALAAMLGMALLASMRTGNTVDIAGQGVSQPAVKVRNEPSAPASPSQPIIAAVAETEQPHYAKAVLKRPSVTRLPQQRKQPQPTHTPDTQFYAVSYAGDPTDADSGGRIVRVEMSRSSLLALGVNVPLENDMGGPVQADLLIGRDGSTRGIRFVQ